MWVFPGHTRPWCYGRVLAEAHAGGWVAFLYQCMNTKTQTSLLVSLMSVVFATQLRAQLPNAWQITDPLGSNGGNLHYTNMLSAAEQNAANADGFHYSIKARFIEDWGAKTMAMVYGLGPDRYIIWFDLNADGDLTAELEGTETFTLTTNSTGTALYHKHEIVYDPVEGTASYLFDGQVKITNWESSAIDFPAGKIQWGEGSTPGKGQMNFHSVRFEIPGLGFVASYDAGTKGNPADAPSPEAQGWSRGGIGGFEQSIAPDNVPLPTMPMILVADASDVEPRQATLSAEIDQGNLAATAWFEWGTDTNYGNSTAPQALLSDTNLFSLSETLTGLTKGATYHFRSVATNLQGIAYGEDQSFAAPLGFSVTTLSDNGPGSLRQSIAHGQSGDTITVATNGTITLTGSELLITNDLTIVGPGPELLVVTGGSHGGAIRVDSTNATVTISGIGFNNSEFGSAQERGVFNRGRLELINCAVADFQDNGGIFNQGTLILDSTTVSNNSAQSGGGIYNDGTASLNNSTVSGNVAHTGGGIHNTANGSLTINTSNLSGNSSRGSGGAIDNGGTLTIESSTFWGNTCEQGGGGINNFRNLSIKNATITANSASSGGGVYHVSSDITAGLTNTIITGNTGNPGANIFDPLDTVFFINCLTNGTPLLAPPGNYGGPTQTMPPLAGSPAIDAGDDSVTNVLSTDQRGFPRVSGAHVDIGAAEAQRASANISPLLTSASFSTMGGTTIFQFAFNTAPNADFTVLTSTKAALPFSVWTPLGLAKQVAPGQYQFTDLGAANQPQRFYQLVSP